MRITLLIFLFIIIGKLSFSQTIIKLTHQAGPMHDYHYVNPTDTAYVFVYRQEDMGQWTEPAYTLKLNVPNGKYEVYINDTLNQVAYIKNNLPDKTWILYWPNGNKRISTSYQDGKLNGKVIKYLDTGEIWTTSTYKNGVIQRRKGRHTRDEETGF